MNPLLDEVLEAHGGAERWRAVKTIRAHGNIGGLLPQRFPGNKLANFTFELATARQYTVIHNFPKSEQRAVFDRGDVRIETIAGEQLACRTNARSAFGGLRGLRRNVHWDPLDLAYFAGYASWNYLTVPFMLNRDDIVVTEGEPCTLSGKKARRLHVTFPENFETHCRRQTFYVGDDGLIVRHDFVAEPVGCWAAAALYSDRHCRISGLLFPMRRRILPRGPGGLVLPGPTLLGLEFSKIEVQSA